MSTMSKEMRPTLPHMLREDFFRIINAIVAGVTRFQVGDRIIYDLKSSCLSVVFCVRALFKIRC